MVSDIKSHPKKIEDNLEKTEIFIEPSEQLEWKFSEDILELHAVDENEFFHTDDEIPPLETEETSIQTHQRQNVKRQNQEEGGIPNRLNPIEDYIPVGGGEEETASSPEIRLELETTIEDGLTDFLHTPSYRSTAPSLRPPVETEEDWGNTLPIELSNQISVLQSRQNTRFEKRQRYLQRRRERRWQNRRERNQNNYYSNYFY